MTGSGPTGGGGDRRWWPRSGLIIGKFAKDGLSEGTDEERCPPRFSPTSQVYRDGRSFYDSFSAQGNCKQQNRQQVALSIRDFEKMSNAACAGSGRLRSLFEDSLARLMSNSNAMHSLPKHMPQGTILDSLKLSNCIAVATALHNPFSIRLEPCDPFAV